MALRPQSRQSQSSRQTVTSKSSEPGSINLFRFHPLRTLQFLTLELMSKLKALDLEASSPSASGSPELKQLYKISKEILTVVKILTKREDEDHKPTGNCKRCEKAKLVTPSNNGGEGDGDGTKQPTEQFQPESSNPNPTTTEPPTEPHQQRRRLEGEIKRLQTMISDKQTLQDGRIVDLNRKLQEATSRCRRLKHTRNESEKRLLYALVENERLRFLLKTQASTITTLKSDFSVIENLTHQQIDLLPDRNTRSPLSNAARHSTSATRGEEHDNKASTNPISSAIIDNHHCNYRHPSGSAAIPSSSPSSSPSCTRLTSAVTSDDDCYLGPGMQQQQSSNADTTTTTTSTQENPDACMVAAVVAEKLRKLRRHYGFKNIAEKESDDGNDANDFPHSPSFSSRFCSSSTPTTTEPLSVPLKTTKTLDDNILDAAAGAAVLRCKPPPPPLGCKRGAGTREKGAKNGSHFKSAPPKSSAAPPPPEKLKSSKSMPSMEFV
nr:uncharacterized protein LOC109428730 [Aedes albopictus]